jgi:hypothetical protein
VARSFHLRFFEADSIEGLTAEQHHVLVALLQELIHQQVPPELDKTVSIRTAP